MDRAALRSIQGPLKARYREDPAAAFVVLRAEGELGDEGVSCSVRTGKALAEAGLHPTTGGDGTLLCSGDMLLEALVACAGVTFRAVAINRGIEVQGGTVRAEGDLDMRGTLGMDPDVAVGFSNIRLSFDLRTNASAEEVESLVATTERYCVVLQTLLRNPEVTVSAGQSPAG
ncbi:MAG TPA: OsmC family protein [Actinomycetota bacterium]|nr:OsmC family protein [Actinomycetota bacterium]